MITIKPIEEQEIIDIFNRGRFEGDLDGVIVSDGTGCTGYSLYRLEDRLVRVLYAQTKDPTLLDGILRATVAIGQNAGAEGFWVEDSTPEMTDWRKKWCKEAQSPISFDVIFHTCHC